MSNVAGNFKHGREWLGAGVGLRSDHLSDLLETCPPVPWFEILIDNYLTGAPVPLEKLDRIARIYPITFHSVSMNLGSLDPLDESYFRSLKQLVERYQPCAISDHVCFSAVDGRQHHDLLPLPYTEEALGIFVRNVQQAQEYLNQKIMIENPSSYLSFQSSEMSEWEFMAEVSKRSGCGILLDLNNVYVSAHNHSFKAKQFIDGMKGLDVGQYHLAGFEDVGTHYLDSHSRPVVEEVWDLYRYALKSIGALPTLIEWDNDIPPLTTLLGEAAKAQGMLNEAQ